MIGALITGGGGDKERSKHYAAKCTLYHQISKCFANITMSHYFPGKQLNRFKHILQMNKLTAEISGWSAESHNKGRSGVVPKLSECPDTGSACHLSSIPWPSL